ncbi:hypothetical protein AVEN_63647-2-1, partial [Araneus ventricosus]
RNSKEVPIDQHTLLPDPRPALIDSPRQAVTSHEFSRTFKRIFFPNRDIEKRVAFSGIIDLSPRSGVQAWLQSLIPYLPL